MSIARALQLREHRASLVYQSRTILDSCHAENRDLSAEEQSQFDKIMSDVDELMARVECLEGGPAKAGRSARSDRVASPVGAAYRAWMIHGEVTPELAAHETRVRAERRDTVIGTDAKGGYLIAPVHVADEIIRQVDNQVFVRRLGTVKKLSEAKKLGAREIVSRMADSAWTPEVGPVVEDTSLGVGRRDLEPTLLSKLVLASMRTLLVDLNAENVVHDELAYKFAVTQERGFILGTGVSQPLGVFTASASGISTARDVATANTATAITGDGLIEAKFALRGNFLADDSLAWLFSRSAVKSIRQLKLAAGTGDYLWSPGLATGDPDKILDVPYYMSEYAPATFTTGQYVGIIGAWRYYWIAEVIDLVIQRLDELYIATNQIGFIGRIWVDGAPILEEAFCRVTLA